MIDFSQEKIAETLNQSEVKIDDARGYNELMDEYSLH